MTQNPGDFQVVWRKHQAYFCALTVERKKKNKKIKTKLRDEEEIRI